MLVLNSWEAAATQEQSLYTFSLAAAGSFSLAGELVEVVRRPGGWQVLAGGSCSSLQPAWQGE